MTLFNSKFSTHIFGHRGHSPHAHPPAALCFGLIPLFVLKTAYHEQSFQTALRNRGKLTSSFIHRQGCFPIALLAPATSSFHRQDGKIQASFPGQHFCSHLIGWTVLHDITLPGESQGFSSFRFICYPQKGKRCGADSSLCLTLALCSERAGVEESPLLGGR